MDADDEIVPRVTVTSEEMVSEWSMVTESEADSDLLCDEDSEDVWELVGAWVKVSDLDLVLSADGVGVAEAVSVLLPNDAVSSLETVFDTGSVRVIVSEEVGDGELLPVSEKDGDLVTLMVGDPEALGIEEKDRVAVGMNVGDAEYVMSEVALSVREAVASAESERVTDSEMVAVEETVPAVDTVSVGVALLV